MRLHFAVLLCLLCSCTGQGRERAQDDGGVRGLDSTTVAEPASGESDAGDQFVPVAVADIDGDAAPDSMLIPVIDDDGRQSRDVPALEIRMGSGKHLRLEPEWCEWAPLDSALVADFSSFSPYVAVLSLRDRAVLYASTSLCLDYEIALIEIVEGEPQFLVREHWDVKEFWREGSGIRFRVQNPYEVYGPFSEGSMGTYSPHLIYEVNETPIGGIAVAFLEDESKQYNDANYAGYYGSKYDEDIRIFYPQDGSKPYRVQE